VHTTRRHYSLMGCMAELTEVRAELGATLIKPEDASREHGACLACEASSC
jgi:hypothetical protein